MIEQITILCAITFALWFMFQKGEIFGGVQTLFQSIPPVMKKPLFDCPVCMHFWYGSIFFWLLYGRSFAGDWKQWLITVIAGIGINAIIVKLMPCCDE